MTASNIQPDDYISFAGLRSFLTGILRLFFKCCRLAGDAVRRHFWVLIGWAVFGGLTGWLYHIAFYRKYKVSMIVESRALDKTVYRNIVSDLNRMIMLGSGQEVAEKLGIPLRLVDKVNKLGTADLEGKPLTEEPGPANPIFQLTGELRSPDGADTLGNAVIGYINGLPFLQSEISEQQRIRQEQLDFIRKEQANIDSLKKDNLLDPASIYRHAYTLDSLRTAIRKYLVHGDKALSPITEFRAANKPQSAPAAFVVIVLALGGFVIGFLISLFLELKKKVQ